MVCTLQKCQARWIHTSSLARDLVQWANKNKNKNQQQKTPH